METTVQVEEIMMIAIIDLTIYLNVPKESVVRWLSGFSSSHYFWHNVACRIVRQENCWVPHSASTQGPLILP